MARFGAVLLSALIGCVAAVGQQPPADEATHPAACQADYRGLGVEKVKAGDEHCGWTPRERKVRALDAACALGSENAEALKALARQRAEKKSSEVRNREGCTCTIELRRWENVYTHVLSQRCWTECGWSAQVECRPEEGGAEGTAEPEA